MPKKDILKLKSAPRLEQVGDNCPKQMEHRDHRVDDELILPYRANRADGISGTTTTNSGADCTRSPARIARPLPDYASSPDACGRDELQTTPRNLGEASGVQPRQS
jgi:hypothetical protein